MSTFCGYFNQGICQSCQWLDRDYSVQLDFKQEKLKALLNEFHSFQLLAPVPSKTIGFRNKAKMIISGTMDNPLIGLPDRDIRDCAIHHPEIVRVLKELPSLILAAKLVPYQIEERKGELKGVILYYSGQSQSLYLRIVLRSKESLDRLKKVVLKFQQKFPALSCISANIQPIPQAILEGPEEIYFTENKSISHQLNDVSFQLSPQGFVQTNQEMAIELYSTAAAWVKETGAEKFAELFSGQGAFSFFIQSQVKSALGIEINSEAVASANKAAIAKNLSHLKFVAMDAGAAQEQILKYAPDAILVNPPRRGLASAVELIKNCGARWFIYSSCNAETLASDLKQLEKFYHIRKAQVFDMFPHTEHFETLVLLEAIYSDKKV